ncbi:MAG: lactate utilization protein [Anaerolineae bacterium]
MSDRTTGTQFLARMRQARQAWHWPWNPGPDLRPTPPAEPPPATDELTAQFAAALTAVGGSVRWAATDDAVLAAVLDILQGRGARAVIVTRHADALAFAPRLADAGYDVTVVGFAPGTTPSADERRAQREVIARADVVLSGADYAIAETSTLAMLAGPHNPRVATLLPPAHIAVLDPARLVPTMPHLVARFKADHVRDGRPDISGLTFISGPSRTGDIEQTLSVGVHGPGEVTVILRHPAP